MVKKKRITLPSNFQELIEDRDIEALKAVYDKCELNAYPNGCYMSTALHQYGVPDSLVRWLVKQGLDIETQDSYGDTPLIEQAGIEIGSNTVKVLLQLGADIKKTDNSGNTALHRAARNLRLKNVRILVENGADVNAKNEDNQTPLAVAISVPRCGFVSEMSEVASVLIEAGAKITPDMKESIKKIGEDFEFHREIYSKKELIKLDAGLNKLYTLFDVEPIAKRQSYDGVSPIIMPKGSWGKQHKELWNYLVPSHGPAKTVQGEVIRITGRVADELYRNGGGNWNKDYRKMLNALVKYFSSGVSLSEKQLDETKELVSSIHARGDDEDSIIDRLSELAVIWVSKNPNPIQMKKPEYNR